MNHLLIGASDKTSRLLELADFTKGFLLIDDGPIAEQFMRGRHKFLDFSSDMPPRFNILKAADDHAKFVQDFTVLFDTIFPEGATTLTRAQSNYLLQNSLRLLLLAHRDTLLDVQTLLLDRRYRAELLARCDDPVVLANWHHIEQWKDYDKAIIPLLQKISSVLMSPLLREVLCYRASTFDLSPERVTIAKIDRAKLGDFNAFLIATLLIGNFAGHIIVPDFGFYGRDFYTSLLRQDRLTVGVNFLSELPPKLQQAVLLINHKSGQHCTWDDAQTLALYAGLTPNTTGHTEFVQRLME